MARTQESFSEHQHPQAEHQLEALEAPMSCAKSQNGRLIACNGFGKMIIFEQVKLGLDAG